MKRCPFCGEMIQAMAVKCRYCKEFIEEDDGGEPVSHHARRPYRNPYTQPANTGPYAGISQEQQPLTVVPSMWALAGSFAYAALLLTASLVLICMPMGAWIGSTLNLAQETTAKAAFVFDMIGIVFGLVVLAWLGLKVANLRRVHYEISPDRIEWARGLLDRKIDNIDMFRIVDMKLYRSVLDCLTGVGTVTLYTKDETSPTFHFDKVKDPRHLYDTIKKASLEADRRQGVIHVE